ncbi:MAG: lamin tail domain-containing protein [Planctomycetota bacterium]
MFKSVSLSLLLLASTVAIAGSTGFGSQHSIVINEVHYDPDVKTELVEFVELHNTGIVDVDLAGWYFAGGISYEFPAGSTLPPGGYIIVAQDPVFIHAKWSSGRLSLPADLVFGPFEGKLDNDGETIRLYSADDQEIDKVDYQLGFPWPTVGNAVPEIQPGAGHSIQLVNPVLDNDLSGSWRSALPTPAAFNNAVYLDNTPPHIRQVKHTPKQPKSDEVMTISAKVTDSDGVANVTLEYQIVEPGSYINMDDWQYRSNWTGVAMHDDGLGGDEMQGDNIYTVQLPGSLQRHRRLIRYRILVVDNRQLSLMVPYRDDPQPNFAYFVYDGVPAWRGAVRPGATPVVEYGTNVMRSLPVYHLISKKSDVETSTWFEKYAGSDYKWYGTLVYDGKVYDHVRYRARGGVWRYAMGKNMWKFNFNRGHRFQARDDYGKKYKTKWDKLNFSACIQQGSFGQRGEHGMFEALSNKLFNMAGVPASETNWVQFRIIDERFEDGTLNTAHSPLTGRGTQYDGDFWGVYMTLEQMDGRFLDEHGLPDGNLYKMDQAYPDGCKLNNQGPTGVADKSDVLNFRSRYQSAFSADWWGSNVNLDSYYGLYAIYHAVWHGDITSKNHFFYLNPEATANEWGTNMLWWQLPWDLDLTWTCYYSSMKDPFSRSGVLSHNIVDIRCRNRVREICDLLFNSEQTNQLIDEYAAVIDDPGGGLSIVDADRAMWDYHWAVGNGAYPQYLNRQASFKAGQGRFYQEAVDRGYQRDFAGMVQVMKDFVVERGSHMDSISRDAAIPRRPVITATCPPAYPINSLTFQTSPFSDPQGGGTFAAMKWHIAEVAPGSQSATQEDGTVLMHDGAEWKYFKGTQEPAAMRAVSWRQPGYDDSSWFRGDTPIGYGESFITTNLSDMRGRYSTVYLRKTFEVTDVDAIGRLVLEAMYDDGVNIWINGVHVVAGNTPSAELPFDATVSNRSENHSFTAFALVDPGSYLASGTNVVAVQVINSYLSNSSDCFIDVRLIAETAEPGAPPAAPRSYSRKPGKYEIDAVWESAELTDSADTTIQMPASIVKVGRTYRVRCRMKDNTDRWSHWSNPVQFVAGEPISAGIAEDLRVTEVMYNPADPPGNNPDDNDEFEFVELKNTGDETIDLAYVSFVDGIAFDFSGGKINNLAPGEFVLVVRNEAAFKSRYGTTLSARIAGEYTGRLSNNGENIILSDFWNGIVAEFAYNDGRGWPLPADGGGHSLVPLASAVRGEPDGTLDYGGNWRASTYLGGSPGSDDPEPVTTIVLNEIMAHTNYHDPKNPRHESNDWIELYNTAPVSVTLHNWYLSDDVGDLTKWSIPAVEIAGGSFISFDEVTGFHNPIDSGFGLSKAGEEVILSYLPGTSENRIVDYVTFKGQPENASLGRYPDGGRYWLEMSPSRDLPNTNPVLDIVIDELMYHPAAETDDEYIELYNPTASRVYLENSEGAWRLDGGGDYTFPANTSIPAGGRLIIVGFDPAADTVRLNAFVAGYGTGLLTPGVNIVGPWSGNLSNSGERLALEKPQPPDQPGDPVSRVIVDEVIYADVPPWPESADGAGDVLQRISADQYRSGNEPDNWKAVSPTPGGEP